ncbi:FUSC family protein [Nocardioides sp. URHA0020]|uniref:FUSC family protein n=1 Tax=Nocardioides sp. URHA0020 TaxID=1380392 RepID=UPI00048E71FB|nr:aromatic acid exporter family protein [Nocardioides sp. URHA0020]
MITGWSGRVRDPVFWNDATQLVKTALAAVLAWVLATEVFSLSQSFLAPWAALLVVHATVYRTFARGLRQVTAAVAGVVLAWAVGSALGFDTVSVAVVLVLGLAIGALPWFGEEAITVAATATVVLTTGFSSDDSALVDRLLDTAIGVAVGLVVNAVVWPPLRRRTAIAAMNRIDDGIGQLLADMGERMEAGYDDADVAEWVDRTRALDDDIDQAWALVRQAQESGRMNPRRPARDLRDPRRSRELLGRMEQALADTRSMARTLGYHAAMRVAWDPDFQQRWPRLLVDAGEAVGAADPDAIRATRQRLNALVDDLGRTGGSAAQWPVHGALIINLRNTLDAMDEVAVANPLGQPPLPGERLRELGSRGRARLQTGPARERDAPSDP